MTNEAGSSVETTVDLEDTCILDTIEAALDALVSTIDFIISIGVGCSMMELVSLENDVASVERLEITFVGVEISLETSISGVENEVCNGVGIIVSTFMETVFNNVLVVPIPSDIAWTVVDEAIELLASDIVSISNDLLIVPASKTKLMLDVDKREVVVLDLTVAMEANTCDEILVAGSDVNT